MNFNDNNMFLKVTTDLNRLNFSLNELIAKIETARSHIREYTANNQTALEVPFRGINEVAETGIKDKIAN